MTFRWGPAFDHYTEAIRLAPGKAAFHNNRAAVALKLGRHSIAAADGYVNICTYEPAGGWIPAPLRPPSPMGPPPSHTRG